MSLTKAEETELARLLGKIEWPLPKEVFHALTPKIITVPIELAVFNNERKVLLLPRPDDDTEFTPGGLHLPGTAVQRGETVAIAMKRLLSNEVISSVEPPRALGYMEIGIDLAPTRPALSLLFATRLSGSYTSTGKFFDPEGLPENTLRHHLVLTREIWKRLPTHFFE